jgi:hypothetical protein
MKLFVCSVILLALVSCNQKADSITDLDDNIEIMEDSKKDIIISTETIKPSYEVYLEENSVYKYKFDSIHIEKEENIDSNDYLPDDNDFVYLIPLDGGGHSFTYSYHKYSTNIEMNRKNVILSNDTNILLYETLGEIGGGHTGIKFFYNSEDDYITMYYDHIFNVAGSGEDEEIDNEFYASYIEYLQFSAIFKR